jgi:hypothetical protein
VKKLQHYIHFIFVTATAKSITFLPGSSASPSSFNVAALLLLRLVVVVVVVVTTVVLVLARHHPLSW